MEKARSLTIPYLTTICHLEAHFASNGHPSSCRCVLSLAFLVDAASATIGFVYAIARLIRKRHGLGAGAFIHRRLDARMVVSSLVDLLALI